MGITKSSSFSDASNQMSNYIKALGSPARLEILQYIKSHPNSTCMNIVDNIALSQSTISKHLLELKVAEIIVSNTIDKSIYYEINHNKLKQIQNYLEVFIDKPKPKKRVTKVLNLSETIDLAALKNDYQNDEININVGKDEISKPLIQLERERNSTRKLINISIFKKYNYTFKHKNNGAT